jgi:hypothetical protein
MFDVDMGNPGALDGVLTATEAWEIFVYLRGLSPLQSNGDQPTNTLISSH